MSEPICAILLHHDEYPLSGLKAVLEGQGVNIRRARTCREAAQLLARAPANCVIFTDLVLPDGKWADVLKLAAGPAGAPVIVVARLVDVRFYVEVIEQGAFDFLAPPFTAREVTHVLRCASDALPRNHPRAGAA